VALQTSGIDSLFDVAVSGGSYFLLKLSLAPADEEHPYGHSRISALTSLGQSVLLSILAVALGFHALSHIHTPQKEHLPAVYLWATSLATFLTLSLWIYLGMIVKKTKSQVVSADRLHYFSDIGSNFLLLICYFLGPHFAAFNLDSSLALVLCGFILIGAYKIAKSSIQNLIDEQNPDVELQIKEVIKSSFPLALGYQRLRSRMSAHMTAVDVELVCCRMKTLEDVHVMAHQVEEQILNKVPHLDLFIHAEPCDQNLCSSRESCQFNRFSPKN
jgi:ferrous-iron efflux pump FieF